ncbi:MAG TPA: type II toxin-antitoxin system PemK/MazF family toxin [Solirubrobacterales bacterium]|nr:type II toxin-antitoxin system PemK/MazF family toxin [Solirubrobacterales bacterium]
MTRGDICWVDLAEEGRRPVLVLTRAEAIPVLPRITVALLTRTIRGLPTEVRLGERDGMPAECVVSLDNIRQVYRAVLEDPITSLAGKRMHEVCKALAVATGCDWRVSRA